MEQGQAQLGRIAWKIGRSRSMSTVAVGLRAALPHFKPFPSQLTPRNSPLAQTSKFRGSGGLTGHHMLQKYLYAPLPQGFAGNCHSLVLPRQEESRTIFLKLKKPYLTSNLSRQSEPF